MILPWAVFTQLAASCAPMVHVDTLAAIAHIESGFHTGAINDNTGKRSYMPHTKEEAIALATELVTVKNHVVDLGLMQVNSKNLADLGMTVADAFDPCKSINAGARALQTAFTPPVPGQDTLPALLQAISRYNTGNSTRGFTNGYVDKVVASAEKIVPAIRSSASRVNGQEGKENSEPVLIPPTAMESVPPPPPPPASWDVFGGARYARKHGASVAAGSNALELLQLPVRLQPVQLQARKTEVSGAR